MQTDLKNILILDIETIACVGSYSELDDRLKKQWDKKSTHLYNSEERSSQELFEERAGIYSEFGKIISIALGFYTQHGDKVGLRVKGLCNHNEVDLLNQFKQIIEKFDQNSLRFCAHNGKEFDFPYLGRRMLVNGIDLPASLELRNKKPWEILHIDTMEEWKFGDRKNFTSLDLLAALFGIDSSKEGIDGSMVNKVYYESNDLDKITEYCMQDVAVTAQVYLKLINNHTFSTDFIELLPL
jgi:DNA polymerase elongation subunit (family B)